LSMVRRRFTRALPARWIKPSAKSKRLKHQYMR
jgi:hypothetical protein